MSIGALSGSSPEEFPPHHTCPWWVGHLLASPLRRLWEDPDRLLRPHVRPGATVVDLGCAMGFFSLPLARLVGDGGRVICADVQARMLRTLDGRIRRRRLQHIVETRLVAPERPGLTDLAGQVDLVIAWHVVHEMQEPAAALRDCFEVLRPEGRLLLAEPRGHVGVARIDHEIELARQAGFQVRQRQDRRRSFLTVLERPA